MSSHRRSPAYFTLTIPLAPCSNTFQLAMGSDSDGRTFATVCYDNLAWITSTSSSTLPVATFTDGVSQFTLLAGAGGTQSSFQNMPCGGTDGVANGTSVWEETEGNGSGFPLILTHTPPVA